MGQKVMTLVEVVRRLGDFDQAYTIYAAEPWTENSPAIVAYEPVEGGLPADAFRLGLSYFLEIAIANDFLHDWSSAQKFPQKDTEKCQRLIDYAVKDA